MTNVSDARDNLPKSERNAYKQLETFFYKYLSQSDTCQLESVYEKKSACTLLKRKSKGTGLTNKLDVNNCQDNFFFKTI